MATISTPTLEISVKNVVVMKIGKATEDLPRVADDDRFRKIPILSQQVGHRATCQQQQQVKFWVSSSSF